MIIVVLRQAATVGFPLGN